MNPLKLLIVDDEPELASIMAEIFESPTLHCKWCSSPMDALKLSENETFDVVLSDISMPGMSGQMMMSEWLRMREKAPLVIFSTGHVDLEQPIIPGIKVIGCLVKPIDERDVTNILQEYFAAKTS